MKAWISLLAAIAAISINIVDAGECDKLPADFNLEGCCKFPVLDSDGKAKKIAAEFLAQKMEPFLLECKVAEALFKELKLAKDDAFDKDAVISHLEKDIKEANWKPVMKAAAEECIKDIMAQKDKIITELEKAPFNIKKDQCNVLYMSMVTCIHLEGFEHCPKETWTEEKKCNDAKAWIEKCGDDIDSMKQLVQTTRK